MWKISRDEPLNLANWPTEFGKISRGELWSLLIGKLSTSRTHCLIAFSV